MNTPMEKVARRRLFRIRTPRLIPVYVPGRRSTHPAVAYVNNALTE
jgi:hypothetical protein